MGLSIFIAQSMYGKVIHVTFDKKIISHRSRHPNKSQETLKKKVQALKMVDRGACGRVACAHATNPRKSKATIMDEENAPTCRRCW